MCTGEIRADREEHARERRMLGVVLVLAAIQELDTGREMFRLVPGVGVDAPAAGCEYAGEENDEQQ